MVSTNHASAAPNAADASAGASGSDSPATIDEVVVTARRAKENLQDVPLTVTEFSAQQLEARGSQSLQDIAALTPGLNYTAYANAGYPILTIRGLAQRAITNFEENVSTFYGGIYLPRAYMVDTGLDGLDRVEVVEGPQSALYGRNAFAGAINYVPLAPPTHPMADLYTTVGNDERFDIGATVGGPLVPDLLAAIVGFRHSAFDGTWPNPHPYSNVNLNGTTGNMGGWDNDSYFAAVTLTPNDATRVTFGWTQTDKDVEDSGTYEIDRNSGGANCDPVGGINQFFCGGLPVRQAIVDPRSQGLHARTNIYRLDAEYQFSPTLSLHYLGGAVASTAYSFDETSVNSVTGDIPGANLIEFLGLPLGTDTSNSHELRLVYDGGATKASGGAFTSYTNDYSIVSLAFEPALGLTGLYPYTPGQIDVADDITHIRTNAVFAQASQDFLERKLNVEVEGRYTEETKSDYNVLGPATYEGKFDYFTPRGVIKWSFTPDNNAYVSAAEGVKSGGFNGGNVLPDERAYQPEKNWTYELGTKNQFLDKRLEVNADIYFVKWSDLQTVSTSANPSFVGTITRNIGTVTDYGLELSVNARPVRQVIANLSFAYANPTYGKGLTDPRFQDIQTATGQPEIVCNNITCPANGSIGGNQIAVESKYQGSFALHYDDNWDVGKGIHYTVGGDVDYKSRQYVDPLLLTWVPGTTLVNLNALFAYERLSLDFWVKNLFNLEYASGAVYTLAPTTDIRYEVSLGDKRTLGVTLRYKL